MIWDYGFGEKENGLIVALKSCPPDFERVQQLLDSGVDLNAGSSKDRSESILSEVILGYPNAEEAACIACVHEDCANCSYPPVPADMDGRYLPQIIKMFLDCGFDPSREDGRVGGRCLLNLTWASYDRYILDAAKLLLHAGVDPECEPDNEGSILGWVATKASAADCCNKDHDLSNLFHTMYNIMDAARTGDSFDDIALYADICGHVMDKVTLYSKNAQPEGLFPCTTDYGNYAHCFREDLVIWCDGMPFCISRYGDALIDRRIPERAAFSCDVSSVFSGCLGSKITNITFTHHELVKGSAHYCQSISYLHLENGKSIRFSINHGEVPREEVSCHLDIIQEKDASGERTSA